MLVTVIFLSAYYLPAKKTDAQNVGSSGAVLSTIAASMQPGSFALLNYDGDASGYGKNLLSTGGVSSIMGYASKAVYDPVSDRVYFSGGEHDGKTKTIHYDIASNTWAEDGLVPSKLQSGHAYDSNATITSARQLYANSTLFANLRRLDLNTNTWSTMRQPPAFYTSEPSVEYFPDRDELLWLQGGRMGGLARYKRVTDSWTTVTTSLSALELRGAIARYVPSERAVLLMGGANSDPLAENLPAVASHALYKYDANGVITRLQDFPSSIWIYPNQAVAVVDPVSSELIVVNAVLNGNLNAYTGAIEMWRYSVGTDTWTQMNSAAVPATKEWWLGPGVPFAVVAVPIPKYGITMFMSAAYEAPGTQSRVYLYKHSSSVNTPTSSPSRPTTTLTFTEKCAQTGVLGCYGFDSASNVRNLPGVSAPYPLKYGGWGGTQPCASAGLGREYVITRGRNSGIPPGSAEYNAFAKAQNGVCYFPTIDTSISASGTGSLRIEVPSNSDAATGGYFDTTFQGLDMPHVRVGPHNGGTLWHQYKYRTHNVASNSFNGAFPDSFIKTIIFGNAPPGLDWLGGDVSLASTFNIAAGFNGNRNGLFQSYTYNAAGHLELTQRTVGSTIYLQTGSQCAYNGAGPYSYPPCVGLVDDKWHEITRHFKLQPVASDFSVSGTTLSRARTFSAGMVGRYIYIGGDGYYRINAFIAANSVTLDAAPSAGSNKTVYISDYPNSLIQEWVDGTLIINNSDQRMAWDLVNSGWGQFRLQPHMTNKDAAIAHSPGTVWYDDIIISSQPIATDAGSVATPRR